MAACGGSKLLSSCYHVTYVINGVVLGTITANGFATCSGDKIALTLNATAPGSFQCSLGGVRPFQRCMCYTMNSIT